MQRANNRWKMLSVGAGLCLTASLAFGCSSNGKSMSDSSGGMSDSGGMMHHNGSMMMASAAGKNIIQTAMGKNMKQMTTLVKAIKAAGLVKPLEGPGPFTVFAPTNAAFDKLPAGTLKSLMMPSHKKWLQQILLYHVHAGAAIMAKDVHTMALETMEGQPLHVSVTKMGVMVDNAKVIKTNVVCSNGVIHWINRVLIPPKVKKEMMAAMSN